PRQWHYDKVPWCSCSSPCNTAKVPLHWARHNLASHRSHQSSQVSPDSALELRTHAPPCLAHGNLNPDTSSKYDSVRHDCRNTPGPAGLVTPTVGEPEHGFDQMAVPLWN